MSQLEGKYCKKKKIPPKVKNVFYSVAAPWEPLSKIKNDSVFLFVIDPAIMREMNSPVEFYNPLLKNSELKMCKI